MQMQYYPHLLLVSDTYRMTYASIYNGALSLTVIVLL